MASRHCLAVDFIIAVISLSAVCCVGETAGEYKRPKARETLDVPSVHNKDGSAPEQVHISQVGSDHMRVSWVTKDNVESMVSYGTTSGQHPNFAKGTSQTYSVLLYKSGNIHDVVIGPLEPNTTYFYRCGANSDREFSFKTTPSTLPIKFAVIGDLGQTGWTNSTLQHLAHWHHDMLLLPGDLSYADKWQKKWDSFGRLVEPLASARPWMVTQGNHEEERFPGVMRRFKAYNARWHMPYEHSASDSNLYYSFDVAGGAVHVVMLGSYADFRASSSQYKWLQTDLDRVDRTKTSWILAVIHAPWYNSNKAHQKEGEAMRKAMEALLYKARVDVVFAGHVHAYERFQRVYDKKADDCGPVHITIGDGGNLEGLATKYLNPKPDISLFREASFGHGKFEVANETHAQWKWHRNDDDEPVVGDQVWLTSLASNPNCNKE